MPVITVQDLGGHVIPLFQHKGNIYPNYPCKDSIINIKTVPIRDDDVFLCSYPKSVMPVITVQDTGGHTMTLFHHEGNVYPNYLCKDSIFNIKTVPIRDDDVFLCSYPKSGLHWTWDTTRMLLAGCLLHDTSEMGSSHLGYAPRDRIKALPSPRLLSTHCRLHLLPPDIVRKGCKIIYIIRNPKDVVVSYYSFIRHQPYYNYKGTWGDYMEPYMLGKFTYGSWFDHVLSWQKEVANCLNISVIYYEDMKEDHLREVRKLDRFLGTNRSEEFLSGLCDFTTFSKMNQRKQASSIEDGSFIQTYRKGEVGDWRNWFTDTQNEWFDKLYWERMKGTDLKIRFSLK